MAGSLWRITRCIFLSAVVLLNLQNAARGDSDTGLVRVGGHLTMGMNWGGQGFQVSFLDRECRKFLFSGWNSWEVLEAAHGTAAALPEDKKNSGEGRKLMEWVMDVGQNAGMNVMRFFAHGWNDEGTVLQTSPGVYNEEALESLDWVLYEAGMRGLKLVMTLSDSQKKGDGRMMYTNAAGKHPMDFYTDPQIMQWYKDNIKVIVNRRNTFTGLKYKDDPTILAWDLLNEPACDCDICEGGQFCELNCADSINSWIEDMALFLKSVDPNHLIVVGEEGFYSKTSEKTWVNPDAFFDGGAPWAVRSGQDFIWNHMSPAIDYLGVHLRPDHWKLPLRWFQAMWLREHKKDAWHLLKPLVVEEFGKVVYQDYGRERRTVRDPFLEQVYETFLEDAKENGPMQGVSFWELDATGDTKRPPVPCGVRPQHSTWNDLVHPYSWIIDDLVKSNPLASYCVPGGKRSMDAVFYKEFLGEGGDFADDDAVYYATHGHHLDTISTFKNIGDTLVGKKPFDCMHACELREGCMAFRYNPDLKQGTCKFYAVASDEYEWSTEGWQVFYKHKAFRSCVDEGCKFCNEREICIKCAKGDLHWDHENERPVCQHDPAAANVMYQRFQFGMPQHATEAVHILPDEN